MPDALLRIQPIGAPNVCTITLDPKIDWYTGQWDKIQGAPLIYPKWKILDGCLYSNRPDALINKIAEDRDERKLVVPEPCREAVIHENHDLPEARYFGVEKPDKQVARTYYWPLIRGCLACQERKSTHVEWSVWRRTRSRQM